MGNKKWYTSKTVITAILGSIGALILALGWDSQYQQWLLLEAPITTILTIVFRWKADKTLS